MVLCLCKILPSLQGSFVNAAVVKARTHHISPDTLMNTTVMHVRCTHNSAWAFRSHPAKAQQSKKRLPRRPVVVQAEKSGLQRLLEPFEGFSKDEEVSFRWDPANLRWAKSKGKLADDASMMITPLIGEPYMVRSPISCGPGISGQQGHINLAGVASSAQLLAEKEAENDQS